MPIRDVALKTCRKQWMIGKGGERESEISALLARHDNDVCLHNDTISSIPIK